MENALTLITKDREERVKYFTDRNKLIEAQRIGERVAYDVEMMREMGYCSGIENYSRYFDGRKPGEPPYTLLDFFPKNFVCFIDESHMTIPQIRGMYNGDRSRKENLVEYGFRLPAAFDNRPLRFDEFEKGFISLCACRRLPPRSSCRKPTRWRNNSYVLRALSTPKFLYAPSKDKSTTLFPKSI